MIPSFDTDKGPVNINAIKTCFTSSSSFYFFPVFGSFVFSCFAVFICFLLRMDGEGKNFTPLYFQKLLDNFNGTCFTCYRTSLIRVGNCTTPQPTARNLYYGSLRQIPLVAEAKGIDFQWCRFCIVYCLHVAMVFCERVKDMYNYSKVDFSPFFFSFVFYRGRFFFFFFFI